MLDDLGRSDFKRRRGRPQVDDDEDTTVSLQTLLKFEGHAVKSAFNACDALRLAPLSRRRASCSTSAS